MGRVVGESMLGPVAILLVEPGRFGLDVTDQRKPLHFRSRTRADRLARLAQPEGRDVFKFLDVRLGRDPWILNSRIQRKQFHYDPSRLVTPVRSGPLGRRRFARGLLHRFSHFR